MPRLCGADGGGDVHHRGVTHLPANAHAVAHAAIVAQPAARTVVFVPVPAQVQGYVRIPAEEPRGGGGGGGAQRRGEAQVAVKLAQGRVKVEAANPNPEPRPLKPNREPRARGPEPESEP